MMHNLLATIVTTDLNPFWDGLLNVLLYIIFGFGSIIVIMCFAALSVVAERKVAGFIQGRFGPNRVVIPFVEAIPFVGSTLRKMGLTQLVADGAKFLLKEDPLPAHVNKFWYMLAPVMSLAPVLIVSAVIPFGIIYLENGAIPLSPSNIDYSLIFALAVSSLGIFGAIMAGWSSNNKYSQQGALRAAAQMMSYELLLGLSVLPVVIWVATKADSPFSLFQIGTAQEGTWFILTHPLSALLFLIALFAETNRLPFDMAESETDLVSGYHTEYGSFKFGLFFVGEYGHVALSCALFSVIFLGAWNPFPGLYWPESWGWIASILSLITMLVKIAMMIFFFIWVRWSLPRFRYDQVMKLCWGNLVPLSLLNLVFYIILIAIL